MAVASTLTSSPSFTAGENLYVSVAREYSVYTHIARVYVNNVGIAFKAFSATTTIEFTQTNNTAIFQELAGATQKESKIVLETYNSQGDLIGIRTYFGDCKSPQGTFLSSSADFNIGADVPLNLGTRANAAFLHVIEVDVNGVNIKTFADVVSGVTWVPSASEKTAMFAQTPNSKTVNTLIKVRTFYNGVQVSTTKLKSGTATVTSASKPTFTTTTYLDTNTAVTAITTSSQWIVQDQSTFRARVLNANKAVAKDGSSITKYIATIEGRSITVNSPFPTDINFDFEEINADIDQVLKITAYDSRGFNTSVSTNIPVCAWDYPRINASIGRANGFEDSTTLVVSGTIDPINANGADRNSLVSANCTYRVREVGGVFGSYTPFLGQVLTMPNFTTSNTVLTLDSTKSWEVEVRITDKFGGRIQLLTVPVGVPLVFIDEVKKSVGVGKFPSGSNMLDVVGDIYLTGRLNESPFTAASLLSGVTNLGGIYPIVAYRINRLGLLELRGGASGTFNTTDVLLFTLPVGLRPFAQMPILAKTSGTSTARIDIKANGDVVYIGNTSASASFLFLNSQVSLS